MMMEYVEANRRAIQAARDCDYALRQRKRPWRAECDRYRIEKPQYVAEHDAYHGYH